MLIGSVSQVALNHIGVLIVDEIRNVAENKNGRNIDTNFIMPDAGGGGYVLRVFANIGCAVIFPNCPRIPGVRLYFPICQQIPGAWLHF